VTHNHNHADHHRLKLQGRRQLAVSLALTAVFFVVELVGGIWTNSLALVGDAGHMLSDVGALGLSLVALTFALKTPTPEKTFGYHRLEILAALLNALVLWGIAGFIFYEAYHRLASPPQVKSQAMLVIASIGLMVNLLCAWILFSSHDKSINLRSAFLHVAADALGSVAAISAALVMLFKGWFWFDPVVSIFIGLLIIVGSYHIVQETAEILMEATPRHIDYAGLQGALEKIPGINNVHDLHVWTISTGIYSLSVHVVADIHQDRDDLIAYINEMLCQEFGLVHNTIQIEGKDCSCSLICCLKTQTADMSFVS
jgi:cobalt-zinc-cadmium efflux system protein